jgi:ABC-type polysaccharide/polyol phosphate export permease
MTNKLKNSEPPRSALKRDFLTIFSLAISDFRKRHAGSSLGAAWVFIQPLVTIFVFWFVFAMGMRTETVQGVPFLIWLVCGLVPWFYFSEALSGASNSLIEHSYLVKKVVFSVGLLPAVKITSSFLAHLIFLALLFALMKISGVDLSWSNLQVFYYIFATTALAGAISSVTTAVVPFFRDLSQMIAIGLQFGMWLTPIMWDDSRLPENLRWVLFLNPVTYIVEGYRDAILRSTWFWQKPEQTLYFWGFVVSVGLLGRVLFRRLRPHFADVL